MFFEDHLLDKVFATAVYNGWCNFLLEIICLKFSEFDPIQRFVIMHIWHEFILEHIHIEDRGIWIILEADVLDGQFSLNRILDRIPFDLSRSYSLLL